MSLDDVRDKDPQLWQVLSAIEYMDDMPILLDAVSATQTWIHARRMANYLKDRVPEVIETLKQLECG